LAPDQLPDAVHVDAFFVDQVSVDDDVAAIVVGDAESVTVGGGGAAQAAVQSRAETTENKGGSLRFMYTSVSEGHHPKVGEDARTGGRSDRAGRTGTHPREGWR
jgi:hypothetical protein